jgi:hypothetical protein
MTEEPRRRTEPPTLLGSLMLAEATKASQELGDLLVEAERQAIADPAPAVELLDAQAAACGTTGPGGSRAVLLTAAGLLLQDSGWLGPARERFGAAAGAAMVSDDVVFATAALGLGGVWVHEHRSVVDRAQVLELQTRALAPLEPSCSLALRLRARLRAEEAYVKGDAGDLAAMLDDVRGLDEPVALADALSLAHHCLLGPEHASQRLGLADELLAVSARTGRRLDASLGLAWRTVDLFLRGDPHAERSLRELRTRVEAVPAACISYLISALDVMLAIRAGRLVEAEELAEHSFDLGTKVGDQDALGWYGAQLAAIRWYQGRTEEMVPMVSDLANSPTMADSNDAFTAALAVTAAAAGRPDEARGALERLRRPGLASLRSSSTWLVTLFGVAEVADLLGDVDAARAAYGLLAPFADWPVMASLAVTCFGSVHRSLGLAAGVTGDFDLAVEHLEAARAADLRLGNVASAALATSRLVQALRRRNRSGDHERAAELERPAAALQGSTMVAPVDLPTSALFECTRCGREWRVRAGGRGVLVPHSVGMEYLAQLISSPGVEIGAAELAGGYQAEVTSGRQDLLDESARVAYRRRVAELRAAIDDADACADLERASRARLELDELLEELGRVTGLSGRSRSFDDAGERARTSVRKAIQRAIAAVTETDPVLGSQLQRSVVTGRRCAYLPGSRSQQ